MIQLLRTDSGNADFRRLVVSLDAYLREKDGEDHAFYNQFNKIDHIRHVVVAYADGKAAGCGAIKKYDEQSAEIKRMFVDPAFRGRGIAGLILAELENWACELSFSSCILETGKRQVEAVRLYQKENYRVIPNYGQYIGVDNSVCMKKELYESTGI